MTNCIADGATGIGVDIGLKVPDVTFNLEAEMGMSPFNE